MEFLRINLKRVHRDLPWIALHIGLYCVLCIDSPQLSGQTGVSIGTPRCPAAVGTWIAVGGCNDTLTIELQCIEYSLYGTIRSPGWQGISLIGFCTDQCELLLETTEPVSVVIEGIEAPQQFLKERMEITGRISRKDETLRGTRTYIDHDTGETIGTSGFVAVKRIE